MKSMGDVLGSSSYANQLSDPRWRAFAQEIKSTRRFCECCKRADVATQVHHPFYDFDRKLWEYSPGEVIVLCESCHHELHDQLKVFRKQVFRHFNGQTLKILNGALAVAMTQYDPLVFVHALAEFVTNRRLIQNHANAWGMRAENKNLNPS